MQGYNPWWAGGSPKAPEFRRLAFRACRQYLADKQLRRAILLSGPRRVGKTTILLQIVDALLGEKTDPKSVFYISLDHPLLKLVTLPEILRLYHENVYPEGKPVVLLLDEIQYSKDWELEIKQLVDHRPEYRVLATGSASVVHKDRISDSGVGRWVTVAIPTLSFYEFLRIRREELPSIPENIRPADIFEMPSGEIADLGRRFRSLMPLFLRYLLVGGFPETARPGDTTFFQRLLREDVVERVLKRDMTALFGVRNVNDLEKLFIYVCLHTGGILAVQSCASALGITTNTVSNHLESLERANLIYRLPPAEIGGKKLLKARYKVYLVDAALRNAVLLRGEEILGNPQELGVIVETAVLRHLYAYHYPDSPQIAYWRNPVTKHEVDIIVQSPAYTIPVEVKYQGTPTLGPDDGIVEFSRKVNPAFAYWVTQREEDFDVRQFEGLRTRFLRVPAHVFCYLLGQAERLLWETATV